MELKESDITMELKAQPSVVRQMSMGADLKSRQALIVKQLSKPMTSKNIKVKVAAIEALSATVLLT